MANLDQTLDASVIITSPNYPLKYNNYDHVNWDFETDDPEKMFLIEVIFLEVRQCLN